MSEASAHQTAPEIDGYTFVRPIGHGGFSDVYLYEQEMPRREVAIKVLRTDDLSDWSRQQFAAEANLMARVSNHSNIAAIFAADVDDEGQPYLVMEFCSGGSLGAFYRHYPMSVKDVLSLGIRLSGALEAAHRAGIVHRDIKPANILLTEYGVPVLADFGISTIDEEFPDATRMRTVTGSGSTGTGESSVGMSLPWAAPETLWDEPVSDTRSDRYSLAATLYSLLEGQSPHEVPGGPNSASHLTGRIRTGFVAAMRRPDLPPSLRQLLLRGLSHDRAARWESSTAFGRALQDVQRELGHEVTPLEVPRGGDVATAPPSPVTRVQQSQPIELPAGHATLAPPAAGAPVTSTAPPVTVPPRPGSAPGGEHATGGTYRPVGTPTGPAASGTVPPGTARTVASSAPAALPWVPGATTAPLLGQHPPPDPRSRRDPVAFAHAGPRSRDGRRPGELPQGLKVATVVVIAALVLALVIVASLLIAQATEGADRADGAAADRGAVVPGTTVVAAAGVVGG